MMKYLKIKAAMVALLFLFSSIGFAGWQDDHTSNHSGINLGNLQSSAAGQVSQTTTRMFIPIKSQLNFEVEIWKDLDTTPVLLVSAKFKTKDFVSGAHTFLVLTHDGTGDTDNGSTATSINYKLDTAKAISTYGVRYEVSGHGTAQIFTGGSLIKLIDGAGVVRVSLVALVGG